MSLLKSSADSRKVWKIALTPSQVNSLRGHLMCDRRMMKRKIKDIEQLIHYFRRRLGKFEPDGEIERGGDLDRFAES